MSLWIFKCNNSGSKSGGAFWGDWYGQFEEAAGSPDIASIWGGPVVTEQPASRSLAEPAQTGQRMQPKATKRSGAEFFLEFDLHPVTYRVVPKSTRR